MKALSMNLNRLPLLLCVLSSLALAHRCAAALLDVEPPEMANPLVDQRPFCAVTRVVCRDAAAARVVAGLLVAVATAIAGHEFRVELQPC
jgi:hypothetical protein